MNTYFGEELVNELRKTADEIKERLWIAVPFIGGPESVLRIIGRAWVDNPGISVRLLTDLDEVNNFSSETIKLFGNVGEIRHLPGLHAKIFILDSLCLITSANLTRTAFAKRHEIGVFLDKPQKAISIFEKWWRKSQKVTEKELESLVVKNRKSIEEKGGRNLPNLWDLPEKPLPPTYWLKPIGTTEDPITHDRKFGKPLDYLHFANPNRTPRVRIGDILIAYGIGVKQILSVYVAMSNPHKVSRKEILRKPRLKRWPWYVEGQNLTPSFGNAWHTHNLYAQDLAKEYTNANPGEAATLSGSQNLNALMFSIDKIKLTPGFAKFVISKVKRLERVMKE